MALVVMAVAPSGEGKSESARDTMVLPGRNTAAIIWLRETEMRELSAVGLYLSARRRI